MLKSIRKDDIWSLKLNGQTILSNRPLRPFATELGAEPIALTENIPAPSRKKNEILFAQGEHSLSMSWEELMDGKGVRLQFASSEPCGYRFALPFIQGEAVYGLSAFETKDGASSLPIFCTDHGRLIVFEPNLCGELKMLRHRYYFTFDVCPTSLSVFLFEDTEEMKQYFPQCLPGRAPDFTMVYSGEGQAKPVLMF